MVEVIVVILVAICQSVFGVGVLLFGTPIFLIMGYGFVEILIMLLPISFMINILQIYPRLNLINKEMVTNTSIISLPLTFALLIFVSKFKIDVSAIIGAILILFSLKSFSLKLDRSFRVAASFGSMPYIVLGLIHGVSNLGGSVLAMLSQINCHDKMVKRTTTAAIYAMLATTQLIALSSVGELTNLSYELILVGIATYLISNRLIFANVDNVQYERAFSVFLFAFGILLLVK